VHGYGTGENGSKLKAVLYFDDDPGYVDTARMLVETGLCLSLEKEVQKVTGGYHTAASACGPQLLSRLIETGCSFSINEDPHTKKSFWRKKS